MQKKKRKNEGAAADPDPGAGEPAVVLDVEPLKKAFGPIDDHFKAKLKDLSQGGPYDPKTLGQLPVTVKSEVEAEAGSGATKVVAESFVLSELAQVIKPSKRTVSLLVHDREYIKPIMSAVQASRDYNQQPQRAEDNDLELVLRVEAQRKEDVVAATKKVANEWRERIRAARSKHEKGFDKLKKQHSVTPDVAYRAEKELQKIQDAKLKEIDQLVAQAVKAAS